MISQMQRHPPFYAYIAGGEGGFYIIDISNPASPTQVGNWKEVNGNNSTHGVYVQGNYAYLADAIYGLIVLDIGNLTNPTLLSSDSTPMNSRHVFVQDDYLYIDNYNGFYIYNTSDPATPRLVKTIPLESMHNLVINQDKAFATANNDITVYDISNPSSAAVFPVIGKFRTPNGISSLCVVNNLIYAAAGTYQGKIIVSSALADNSPREVTVTLTVQPGKPGPGVELPFGVFDTPTDGAVVRSSIPVSGWALTPPPKTIPKDGSAITVWVDGEPLGHPVYNVYRSDIAQLFPGYNNSEGAVGYFSLDTTKYENGVHTIQWSVKDNFGYSDGIGIRYFTIQNNNPIATQSGTNAGSDMAVVFPGPREKTPVHPRQEDDQGLPIEIDINEPVWVKTGYDVDSGASAVYPGAAGAVEIAIPEAERVEIHFAGPAAALGLLPIGSSLDRERGIFYWQPGAGVLGTHRLVFKTVDSTGKQWKKTIFITLKPIS
jgi:hypothetical protein